MKTLKILILQIIIICIIGCATGYNKIGLNGGYSETYINENTYNVSFKGNSYTSMESAIDFTLLRSAELALKNGYAFFVVQDFNKGKTYTTYTTPGTSETEVSYSGGKEINTLTSSTITYPAETRVESNPNTTVTIIVYKEKPKTDKIIYNAKIVFDTLSEKYKIHE